MPNAQISQSLKNTISWSDEVRDLNDLVPADYNPRNLTETERTNLFKSLNKFNLADPIIINKDNTIIGGHQRVKVLFDLDRDEVSVRVPDRQLTKDEEKELNLRLNKNVGHWDDDLLLNFDKDMLLDVGFSDDLFISPEIIDEIALPSGDKEGFQQITFLLTDDQMEVVKEAIASSKSMGEFLETGNENSNGNAIARVCEFFNGKC